MQTTLRMTYIAIFKLVSFNVYTPVQNKDVDIIPKLKSELRIVPKISLSDLIVSKRYY